MEKQKCCGNCEHGEYDKDYGYSCSNDNSWYFSDYVEHDHQCDEWEEKTECE